MIRRRYFFSIFLVLVCCNQSHVQGSFTDIGIPSSLSLPEGMTVNTFAQVGFQWIGSNMTLPPLQESIPLPPPFSLTFGDTDWQLKDANFWTGSAGFSVIVSEIYSIFASAGGLLDRPFVSSGLFPVTFTGVSATNFLEFTSTNVESWFIQAGAGLGPFIGGVYFDHFGYSMSDPRSQTGPAPNQTIRGDVMTKSICPFIGISLPAGGALATIIYSPLASFKSTLALRNFQNRLSETEYSGTKPGQFLSAMVQYNTPLSSSISFGLWANCLWMRIQGNADATLRSSDLPAPISTPITVTVSKYAYGGGLALGYNF